VKPSAPTDRAIRRLLLTAAVGKIHGESRGTYGYPRVTAKLRIESELIVNHKLVASIMQQLQLHGLPKRRTARRNLIAVRTTSDLYKRDFNTSGPNQLWVTDITEHPTREARVFHCVVLDAYSRKAVGWSIDRIADASLVNSALHMAGTSRPTTPETIIHADHGAQFTSWAFNSNVRNYGLKLSLGTVGDCFDNAVIESFWGRMQTELLNRKSWTTVVELSMAMADYIDNFHNTRRRHSSLAILTPTEYEITNQNLLQLS
jgi:putative transposase